MVTAVGFPFNLLNPNPNYKHTLPFNGQNSSLHVFKVPATYLLQEKNASSLCLAFAPFQKLQKMETVFASALPRARFLQAHQLACDSYHIQNKIGEDAAPRFATGCNGRATPYTLNAAGRTQTT
jgi:hypothetical protein